MKRVLSAALLVAALTGSPAQAQELDARTIVTGLEFPTAITFGEDGTMYVNERIGRIRVVEDGELLPEPLAEITTTDSAEMGLLGSDLSPDEGSLYVFATTPDGTENQIWRVPLDSGEPELVFDGMPASSYHNGGGVVFDEDGMLLISNGESHTAQRSQDPNVLGGKIYRIDENGRPAADDPFEGPTYALGLRNPFGMTIDPVSGAAYVTENGPESHDEVNRIEPGWNLGWPDISGPAGGASPSGPGEYHDPVSDYPQIIVPTGIAFADPDAEPFGGDLFFAAYGELAIHRLELDRSRTQAVNDEIVHRSEEPIVALEWGPEGLYFSTPSSIQLLPFGDASQGAGEQPSPTPAESETPTPTVSPSLPPRELSPAGTIVFLVVAAILAFGVIYTIRRGKALRKTQED